LQFEVPTVIHFSLFTLKNIFKFKNNIILGDEKKLLH